MTYLIKELYTFKQKVQSLEEQILPKIHQAEKMATQFSESFIYQIFFSEEPYQLDNSLTLPQILDEIFHFNFQNLANLVTQASYQIENLGNMMVYKARNEGIREVFYGVETYSDLIYSISKVATTVPPFGGLKNKLGNATSNSTNLDKTLETLGELFPFVKKQLDLKQWKTTAETCTVLINNFYSVNWVGNYWRYDKWGRQQVVWKLPFVVSNDILSTVYDICDIVKNWKV